MPLRTHHNQSGFSTIELLIAFGVGIVFLTAAMMVAFSDPTLTKKVSVDSGHAAALDATLDNNGLSYAKNKLGALASAVMGNWSTTTNSGADDSNFYDDTATITDIAPCLKVLSNQTDWNTIGTRGRSIGFATALSSSSIAIAMGPGGCDPIPAGDWDNPDTFGTFDPTGIPGANSGVSATAISVKSIGGNQYAFLTSTHNNKDTPDFWVMNVNNPASPQFVANLDLSNGVQWGGGRPEGANDLVVVGNYAYVLRNYKTDQLQVIDISNPNTPTTTSPAISFEPRGVAQNGSDPQGEVIRYHNGRLYIGLKTTIGPELLVYNIATTPQTPTFVGAIASNFNHSITDIAINGTVAYLAIAPGTGAGAQNTRELMVVNIANNNPTDTGNGYNARSGPNNGNGDTEAATALYLLNNRLYVGRERVSSNQEKDLYIFNVTTPNNPTLLGNGTNLGQLSGAVITGMHVSGNLLFLGTTKNNELQIWNISNPNNVTIHACGGFNFPQEVSGLAYADNLIFAAIRSNAFFRVIHDVTTDNVCN